MSQDVIQIKNPLPESISELIKKYSNQNDIVNAAQSFGFTYEILKRVVYRTANVTDNNIQAVEKLIEIAQNNCIKVMYEAKNDLPLIHKLIKNKTGKKYATAS